MKLPSDCSSGDCGSRRNEREVIILNKLQLFLTRKILILLIAAKPTKSPLPFSIPCHFPPIWKQSERIPVHKHKKPHFLNTNKNHNTKSLYSKIKSRSQISSPNLIFPQNSSPYKFLNSTSPSAAVAFFSFSLPTANFTSSLCSIVLFQTVVSSRPFATELSRL